MSAEENNKKNLFRNRRTKLLGLDGGQFIKGFFGSNALVSILVLSLITIFLFKEGAGFFKQNLTGLRLYRMAGLEYVDIVRQQNEDFLALNRYLNSIRADHSKILADQGLNFREIQAELKGKNPFYDEFSRLNRPLSSLLAEMSDAAVAIREQRIINLNQEERKQFIQEKINVLEKRQKLEEGDFFEFSKKIQEVANQNRSDPAAQKALLEKSEAIANQQYQKEDVAYFVELLRRDLEGIVIKEIDFGKEVQQVTAYYDEYKKVSESFQQEILRVVEHPIIYGNPSLDHKVERFVDLSRQYVKTFPASYIKLEKWKYDEPVPAFDAVSSFLTGKDWTTASDWTDVYGILPLFTGSLMVSGIALFFAIPFGVGAAIYVNQLASLREQNLIKPYIEFISAIPSVVIGFFGIAVFGTFIRYVSQLESLSWVPFFPISERLNSFTAGGLLALMAIPTIFTLCEDALNNVPKSFKEASFALGGNKLQTIFRVTFPCALSGIISAILLGFGRVIGETMVVLLCAGNRIKIPDFVNGVGTIFEPVHTMTGIIAQEMGEVVNGSIHYRALFVVGMTLFFVSLLVNYLSQVIVRKYKLSNG